ncbi:hypothetical protein BBR47_05090 [Brevibacillus brevis NBRC 100599]|uniref:Uncharacterized protein n=1 Tax=Brevibacillus brevis (strain 47 / JCM 6285 / NBRC 100599) TaxID=358681 RepID=C0ZK35_BREBN|nr:hypothetical protein BBR47_05090 [Brevibacillus brevis NBRC 100599]
MAKGLGKKFAGYLLYQHLQFRIGHLISSASFFSP